MVKRLLCCLISISFSISCFSQQIKKVEGEYSYIVPDIIYTTSYKSDYQNKSPPITNSW